MNIKTLRVASVFSGIGAFEQALKLMKLPHDIKFACDNGERTLKLPFRKIHKLCNGLSDAQKPRFARYLIEGNKLEKQPDLHYIILASLLGGKITYLKSLELPKECIDMLTLGMNNSTKEEYVNKLYQETGRHNFVKDSYLANYNLNPQDWHEDIRFLDGTEYANQVDILVGGSPCQSFSTYGKKLGLEDTRGTLFYDYARIIKEIQPKVFIYENVKNLQTRDDGKTWDVMRQVWESLDYVLSEKILNAKDYGTPQNRTRLFLVGFRKDVIGDSKYTFPVEHGYKKSALEMLEKEGTVDESYYLGKKGFEWVTNPKKNKNKTRVAKEVVGCQTANQQDNWIGDLVVEEVQPRFENHPRVYVGEYGGKRCVARKMIPDECLRLMGFGEFKHVVSDKELYRQSGNSIVVSVMQALLESIMPFIKK